MLAAITAQEDTRSAHKQGQAKKHTSDLMYQEEQRLRAHLQYYANRGRQYHAKGAIKKAAESFNECIRISRLLLLSKETNEDHSGLELLFIASHNMAACCNQLQAASEGEKILRDLYRQVVNLCENTDYHRDIRLEALSVLDKSLFSLASQMAYMGQLEPLQALINYTESLAEKINNELNPPALAMTP